MLDTLYSLSRVSGPVHEINIIHTLYRVQLGQNLDPLDEKIKSVGYCFSSNRCTRMFNQKNLGLKKDFAASKISKISSCSYVRNFFICLF